MCGIFAYSGQSPKGSQIIFEGLKRLEYRGYDSWGIAVVKKGEIKLEKHVGQIGKKKPQLPSSNFGVGRGQSHPIALEAALKIKEISYIHAEGFAGGELKHGVIALVEKGTPCLVLAPEDESYSGIISGAMEMKARGGFIIGLSSKKNPVFDHYFPVADCGEATVIPQTVVSQLLAYYLAVGRGLNPDRPRNLAKSVTVK